MLLGPEHWVEGVWDRHRHQRVEACILQVCYFTYTMQPEKIIIHTIKATQKYQHKTYLTKCNLILSHRHNIFFKQ